MFLFFFDAFWGLFDAILKAFEALSQVEKTAEGKKCADELRVMIRQSWTAAYEAKLKGISRGLDSFPGNLNEFKSFK